MRTVSGSVISTNPISLSQATASLSKFVSADSNGASQPMSAYLLRTLASFKELKKLHKDLSISAHKRKHRTSDHVDAHSEPKRKKHRH